MSINEALDTCPKCGHPTLVCTGCNHPPHSCLCFPRKPKKTCRNCAANKKDNK